MATTTANRIDAGALTNAMVGVMAGALAETVVLACERLDEGGRPLDEIQKVELTRTALLSMRRLELEVVTVIVDDLDQAGIERWGLDRELERLLPTGGDS
jgi:hypothetical protein